MFPLGGVGGVWEYPCMPRRHTSISISINIRGCLYNLGTILTQEKHVPLHTLIEMDNLSRREIFRWLDAALCLEIGRASCRERVYVLV